MHRWIQEADIQLIEQSSDQIKWRHEASGTYTANSAYKAQFLGRTASEISNFTWKTWAPQRLKIFIWLLTKNRLWCNDRLQRRGWQNSYFCQLCLRNLESADHLFWKCNVATAVWVETASRTGCASLSPTIWAHNKTAGEIITKMICKARPEYKKGTRTMIVLVLSEIWKERNECTFRNKTARAASISTSITTTLQSWRQAGAVFLEHPFGEIT